MAISHLFDGIRFINSVSDGKESVSEQDLRELKTLYQNLVFDVLGLKEEQEESGKNSLLNTELIKLLLEFRNEAKQKKSGSSLTN